MTLTLANLADAQGSHASSDSQDSAHHVEEKDVKDKIGSAPATAERLPLTDRLSVETESSTRQAGNMKRLTEKELMNYKNEIKRMEKENDLTFIHGASRTSKPSEKLSLDTTSRARFYTRNCRSINSRISYCSFFYKITGVTLVKRYSHVACFAGYDYAYFSRYLIVADGCNGQFLVKTV